MNRQVNNLLIDVATVGDIDSVMAALANGASVNAHDAAALRWASGKGHINVVRALVAAGANARALTEALQWASEGGLRAVHKRMGIRILVWERHGASQQQLDPMWVEHGER